MANLIRVIGVGPGNPEYMTPMARNLVECADILIGGERLLEVYRKSGKELYIIRNNLMDMVEFIRNRRDDCQIAVLASGDPSFYGILEYLKRYFRTTELQVVPGLSSIQLACAALCISWHDAAFYSVHGRDMEGLVELVRDNAKVIVLTDPKKTPAVIAAELVSQGVSERKVYVCENLSYNNEQIREFSLDSVPRDAGSSGCVVVIMNE